MLQRYRDCRRSDSEGHRGASERGRHRGERTGPLREEEGEGVAQGARETAGGTSRQIRRGYGVSQNRQDRRGRTKKGDSAERKN